MTRSLPPVLLMALVVTCGPTEALPDEPALVVLVDGQTLTRSDADGVRPLFTFGQGVSADFVKVMQWEVQGRFIGGFAFLPLGDVLTYEYLVCSTAGEVLFHHRRVESGHPTVHLGADGSLAVAGDAGFLARADGSVIELGALLPMTPVLAGGALVVSRGAPWEPSSQKSLWREGTLQPLSLEFTSLTVAVGRALVVAGGALRSLEDGKSVQLPEPGMQFVMQGADGRVLLARVGGAVAVADLARGTAQQVVNLPELLERHGSWTLALGSDGAVLAGAQVEGKLQLRRTADLGATWSDVGAPMDPGPELGAGTWLFPVERAGSVLLLNISTGYGHFLSGLQFVTAAGGQPFPLEGHFVTPGLLSESVDVSPDGRRAAAWEGEALVLLGAGGEERVVLTSTEPGQVRFLDL